MWVGGEEASSGGSRLQSRTWIPMDPAPLGGELQLQHLPLHTSGICSEQPNTRWFKAREGNWIFTCHTSRPDSCWFHLAKPLGKGKGPTCWPTPISWEREQPTAGAACQESPCGSHHGAWACSHQELPGTPAKSLHCSPAQAQPSQRDAKGAGGSSP